MFPIVLAHGIARFDILREKLAKELKIPANPLDDKLQYFRNIRTFLEANGFSNIKNTNVEFAGSLRERAENLKTEISTFLAAKAAPKVHVIAHSMGGLDAREMIVELGMGDKVASLTTIGAPHLGTPLADRLLGFGGAFLLSNLEKNFKLKLTGFNDLTTEACKAFNQKWEDAEARNEVFYQTYSSSENVNQMFLPLVISWAILQAHGESNDGLVPVSSQKWKSKLSAADGTTKDIVQKEFPMTADHLNQVGWWDSGEAVSPIIGGSFADQRKNFETQIKNVYLGIVQDLKAKFA